MMSAFAKTCIGMLWLVAAAMIPTAPLCAQQPKPNILVIMGDDIGYWNISAYNLGMMGYHTPNIDRIAAEGGNFHRLLRPAVLHRGARGVHHRAEPVAHRASQSGTALGQGGVVC
jgi:hypothetical protein